MEASGLVLELIWWARTCSCRKRYKRAGQFAQGHSKFGLCSLKTYSVPSLVWMLSCGEARGQNCKFLLARHSISGMDLASSIKCGNHLGEESQRGATCEGGVCGTGLNTKGPGRT